MSWQSDIVNAILTDSAVCAIIGENVFADVAAGNATAPFIVYQQVSDSSETTLDGARSVSFPLVQFSCWASTKSGAIDLASKLKAAIEGRNLPGDSNASLSFSNQISMRDQQTKLFGEMIDYRVSCLTN
jgi:hypothetical protein